MIELDLRSRIPIYSQIVEKFKELIIQDVMKPDEQLPSVRTLAQEISINPNTIQKAYRELETQGYVYSVAGKGSFVNHVTMNENLEKLRKMQAPLKKLIAEAMYLGMTKEQLIEMMSEIDKGEK